MRIELFLLCDAATEDTNKMNILGVFDTIWSPSVPTTHPQCSIAMRIRFNKNEKGKHKITVKFIDSDDKLIIPTAHGTAEVDFSKGQPSGTVNLILNIQGLKLMEYGEYSILLSIDGKQKADLPLFVKPIPDKNNES